jgi:hypothetical protein
MVLLSKLSEEDPFITDPGYVPPQNTGVITVTGQDDARGYDTNPAAVSGKGVGGGGGSGFGIGDGFAGLDVGNAPAFRGSRFSLPTAESVLNLPGYKFREQQGRDALEHSAAAKGLTRTGGTLKDLATWNQGFASQEYDAEARRQLGAFQQNYQAEKDEFAPTFANWQFLSNAALQKALAQYGRGTVWNNPNSGGGGGGGGGVLSYEEWKQQNGYA